MRRIETDTICLLLVWSFIGLLLIGAVMWGWYRAGIQQHVYEREGIHMSQWEIFIGTRPLERTINIKE